MKTNKKELTPDQRVELLSVLKARFEKNMNRHKGLEWPKLQAKLEANPEKLWSLDEMERTGGEPDVVGQDKKTGQYIFYDCAQKALKAAEVFVMTIKRWSREKKTNRNIARWRWQPTWGSSF